METNNQNWEEIWQEFTNAENQQLGLGLFDDRDLADDNPYTVPNLEAAFGSDPLTCEGVHCRAQRQRCLGGDFAPRSAQNAD
jgi:hypothetical protein